MISRRSLKQDEINEAKLVFGNTIDYKKVYIANLTDGAMTILYQDKQWNYFYVIFWSKDVYNNSAVIQKRSETLIHELTHVWQGHHGKFPEEYMIKSGASQTGGVFEDAWDKGLKETVKRIWNNGPLKTWNDYRSRAYVFSMVEIGVKNWNEFNVEQQASIVESWYAPIGKANYLNEPIPDGNRSINDVRYPYIQRNILAKSVNAKYVPLTPPKPQQLGKGADSTIKAIEDLLVRLRFLNPKYADGYVDKHTRDAVRGFQRANGLKVDGDIGGANSETRKKMGIR